MGGEGLDTWLTPGIAGEESVGLKVRRVKGVG